MLIHKILSIAFHRIEDILVYRIILYSGGILKKKKFIYESLKIFIKIAVKNFFLTLFTFSGKVIATIFIGNFENLHRYEVQ